MPGKQTEICEESRKVLIQMRNTTSLGKKVYNRLQLIRKKLMQEIRAITFTEFGAQGQLQQKGSH